MSTNPDRDIEIRIDGLILRRLRDIRIAGGSSPVYEQLRAECEAIVRKKMQGEEGNFSKLDPGYRTWCMAQDRDAVRRGQHLQTRYELAKRYRALLKSGELPEMFRPGAPRARPLEPPHLQLVYSRD